LCIKTLRFDVDANFNRHFAVQDKRYKNLVSRKLVLIYVCDFNSKEYSKKILEKLIKCIKFCKDIF